MAIIQIRKLCKSYGSHQILKDLDLDIMPGETLVILGRSGVGKSVLLKHIIGLEKPDSGAIEINDQQASKMGMLFQASALFDSMTIEENTSFYLHQHPCEEGRRLTQKEIRDRTLRALAMVGLEGKEHLMPSDLSGGMRKRAALARLIVYRPHVLLYDEPTTGLDPITAMQINELIVTTQQELQATSIVVTHDLCSAFYVADRIAFSHDGRIVYLASKEEFVKIDDPLVQSFLKNAIPYG